MNNLNVDPRETDLLYNKVPVIVSSIYLFLSLGMKNEKKEHPISVNLGSIHDGYVSLANCKLHLSHF